MDPLWDMEVIDLLSEEDEENVDVDRLSEVELLEVDPLQDITMEEEEYVGEVKAEADGGAMVLSSEESEEGGEESVNAEAYGGVMVLASEEIEEDGEESVNAEAYGGVMVLASEEIEEDDEESVNAKADGGVQALTSAEEPVFSEFKIPSLPIRALQKPRITPGKSRESFYLTQSLSAPNTNDFMGGSCTSEEELDDGDDAYIEPAKESDFLDLQDPLEKAHLPRVWKIMSKKRQRATMRAYYSRIAGLLPDQFPRNSKLDILKSANQHLKEICRKNASLAVEKEELMQNHRKLLKAKMKLEKKTKMEI